MQGREEAAMNDGIRHPMVPFDDMEIRVDSDLNTQHVVVRISFTPQALIRALVRGRLDLQLPFPVLRSWLGEKAA